MYFIAQTEIAQITGLSQAGRLSPFSFWQTSLTLSQPGGQIMPTTVLKAPPLQIFRPSDGPFSPQNFHIII